MINLVNGGIFVSQVVQRRIVPHMVTWLFWSIGPYLAFAAQLSEGVGLPALVTFVVGLDPTVIFFVALFYGNSTWRISRFDVACGVAAAVGLILWAVFWEARLAILFAIVADALAAVPTFRKAFVDPATENWRLYGLLAASGLITYASSPERGFAVTAFAGYLALLGIALSVLIVIRSRQITPARP
ncbi:hypothetical protein [Cryptosporangium phraense]|uniref:Uncharacterized protein n=1 Tax=Cryptosporangium phraense TaxID=2593070 RepID=A0A545AW28_9ACTN|nr:hypothetical protein [Cryptosporangium phraense]TQS45536.1 hypothetical protein FL583_07300 [Cryptosporangium phraense]